MRNLIAIFAAAIVCAWGSSVRAAYMFSDLHPSGHATSGVYWAQGSQQVGFYTDDGDTSKAALWTGSAGSFVSLHPDGFLNSEANSISGSTQVGTAYTVSQAQAMMWNYTAASAVSLHPAGALYSYGYGAYGNQQVGRVDAMINNELVEQAMLWTGTAQSGVALNPAGFTGAVAYAIFGNQQVGAALDANFDEYAAIWAGTAESFVNLHPAGYTDSLIYGTDAVHQAGQALAGPQWHAAAWAGSAASFTDLQLQTLPGYIRSGAYFVSGDMIVGFGDDTQDVEHALLWVGSSHTLVDLNDYLPANFNGAYATGIGSDGTIYGTAYTETASGLLYEAVAWTPVVVVPEPGVLSCVALLLVAGRRRSVR